MHLSDKNSSKHCGLFPQLFAIYYAFAFLFEGNLCQICIRNNKKCWSFSTKTHCIQHQIALQFAPKRKAFSTKAQTKDMKIGCKGLFINKLALKDKKRFGDFWRSTQLCPAPQVYAKKAVFCALFLANSCKSCCYKLEKYAPNFAPHPKILRRGHSQC